MKLRKTEITEWVLEDVELNYYATGAAQRSHIVKTVVVKLHTHPPDAEGDTHWLDWDLLGVECRTDGKVDRRVKTRRIAPYHQSGALSIVRNMLDQIRRLDSTPGVADLAYKMATEAWNEALIARRKRDLAVKRLCNPA